MARARKKQKSFSMNIALQRLFCVLLIWVCANPSAFAHDELFIDSVFNQAKLQGSGKFTYWGFQIYDATLYREALPNSAEFALEIRYHKSFSGLAIAKKSADEMKRLVISESQANNWGKKLAVLLPNIEAGQSLTAVYMPKQGTLFYHDRSQIGQISDADFAKAFFSIWLDLNTSAPKLRNDLLGKNCPPPLISEIC